MLLSSHAETEWKLQQQSSMKMLPQIFLLTGGKKKKRWKSSWDGEYLIDEDTEYCKACFSSEELELCLSLACGFWRICKEEIPTTSIKLECSLWAVWKLSGRSSSCSGCSLKLALSDGILSSRELLKIINLWKICLKHWVLSLETSVLLTSSVRSFCVTYCCGGVMILRAEDDVLVLTSGFSAS